MIQNIATFWPYILLLLLIAPYFMVGSCLRQFLETYILYSIPMGEHTELCHCLRKKTALHCLNDMIIILYVDSVLVALPELWSRKLDLEADYCNIFPDMFSFIHITKYNWRGFFFILCGFNCKQNISKWFWALKSVFVSSVNLDLFS